MATAIVNAKGSREEKREYSLVTRKLSLVNEYSASFSLLTKADTIYFTYREFRVIFFLKMPRNADFNYIFNKLAFRVIL